MKTFTRTPLIAIRRTAWKSALREFEWFMSGSNNIKDLHPSVHKWWEPWANLEGNIVNNYSQQFKKFHGRLDSPIIDQVEYLKESIVEHPYSRRAVITTWNTADMVSLATPITNCHGTTIQAFVEPRDNTLHLTMYQRSSDMVLGLPHNLIQYWAFLQYLAHHGGRGVGSFTWIGGDCHIYDNHVDMAKRMISESIEPLEEIELVYNPTSEEFLADDFTLSAKYDPIIKESLEMTV
jgi:thymidylate synthase